MGGTRRWHRAGAVLVAAGVLAGCSGEAELGSTRRATTTSRPGVDGDPSTSAAPSDTTGAGSTATSSPGGGPSSTSATGTPGGPPGSGAGSGSTTPGAPGPGGGTVPTVPPSTPPEPPIQVVGCEATAEQVVSSAGVSISPEGYVLLTWSSSRVLDPSAHAFLTDLAGRFQVAVSTSAGVTSVQVLDRSTGEVSLQPADAFDDGEVASATVARAAMPGVDVGAFFTAVATERGGQVGCVRGAATAGG